MDSKILAELDFVFSQLPPSYKSKLPEQMLEQAKNQKDIQHYNTFDESKPFTQQKLSDKTLEILDKIFRKYFDVED